MKQKKRRTGTGPRKRRTTTLHDVCLNVRTRKPSLFEHRQELVFDKGVPARHSPRTWHPRNIGELLLGTGWRSLEEKSLWCTLPANRSHDKLPLADCFAVELPFGYAWIADKYRIDIARLYPGRIEMPTCDKPHRIAVLDIEAEDPYRSRAIPEHCYELIVEKFCSCFHDGRLHHEGDIVLYRWR